MGPIPLVPGSWLSYMHSSLSPLGVNLCVLVVPQLLWRWVLHLLLSRLQEGGSWTLSYEKMFSSLRPSLVDHPCYKQTFSMLVILRAHPKPIHSHQLCLFSQTKTQNTITSLLSTPLFLWTFSHSCIVFVTISFSYAYHNRTDPTFSLWTLDVTITSLWHHLPMTSLWPHSTPMTSPLSTLLHYDVITGTL